MWYEVEVSSTITIAVEADSEEQAKEVAKEEASGIEASSLFTEMSRLEVESVTETEKPDYSDIVVEEWAMWYEVEVTRTVTMTVEAASKKQAEEIADDVLDDFYVESALEESTEVNVKSELDDNDYYTLFVDNSGTVHQMY